MRGSDLVERRRRLMDDWMHYLNGQRQKLPDSLFGSVSV